MILHSKTRYNQKFVWRYKKPTLNFFIFQVKTIREVLEKTERDTAWINPLEVDMQ